MSHIRQIIKMKKFTLMILGLLLSSQFLFAKTAPCLSSKNCKAKFYSKENYLTYYSTYSLKKKNTSIKRLVVVVHGALRNGDDYFNDTALAAKKFGLLDSVMVLAPHFRKVTDEREEGEHYWGRRWYTKWKYGYRSEDSDKISSFEIIDNLLLSIDRSNKFPNLKEIVITGHSAGGQFTQRYAVATKVATNLRQNLTIVPSNPSSYMFLDEARYEFSDANYVEKEIDGSCNEYNHYIYGPIDRASYMANMSVPQLVKNFAKQKVIYLMSEEDKGIDSLDRSCEANLQGKNRFERAQNFYYYVKKHITADNHRFLSIPGIGHEHVDVYESEEAKEVVFGVKGGKSKNFLYKKIGSKKDVTIATEKAFAMFGGGRNEINGMRRFLAAAKGGDLLVLSGKTLLNQRYTHDFWRMAQEFKIKLDSVETISFLNKDAGSSSFVLDKIKKAEAIFFTGGNQAKYINFIKGTKAHQLIMKKQVPIGGTSAGLAIMGEYIFSAKRGGFRSSTVLRNPHHRDITLEKDFFKSDLTANLITDTHFSERRREGRLLGFMFKAMFDFNLKEIYGLGIDEETSLFMEKNGSMKSQGKGNTWFYHSKDNSVQRQQGALNFGPVAYKKLINNKIYPHYSNIMTTKWNILKVVDGVIK